jgi:viroplasmin and RNaseH domain-containing protein
MKSQKRYYVTWTAECPYIFDNFEDLWEQISEDPTAVFAEFDSILGAAYAYSHTIEEAYQEELCILKNIEYVRGQKLPVDML